MDQDQFPLVAPSIARAADLGLDENDKPRPLIARLEQASVDKHIPLIQRYAKVEVKPEDVHVFGARIINTKPISFYGQFELSALKEMVATYPGRPTMFEHNTYTSMPVGKFHTSEVTFIDSSDPKEENYWGTAWFYMPRGIQVCDDTARMIEMGVYDESSASWQFSEMKCSCCASDMRWCAHWPGEVYRDGGLALFRMSGILFNLEGSIVFAGASQGTHMVLPRAASATARALSQPGAMKANASAWASHFSGSSVEDFFAAKRAAMESQEPAAGFAAMFGVASASESERPEPLRRDVAAVYCARERFEKREDAGAYVRRIGFRSDEAETHGDWHEFRQSHVAGKEKVDQGQSFSLTKDKAVRAATLSSEESKKSSASEKPEGKELSPIAKLFVGA